MKHEVLSFIKDKHFQRGGNHRASYCQPDLWLIMALQVGGLADPLNRPVLIFGDLYCFGPLKKYTAGKGFATDTDVQQAVTSWLQTLVTDLFCARLW